MDNGIVERLVVSLNLTGEPTLPTTVYAKNTVTNERVIFSCPCEISTPLAPQIQACGEDNLLDFGL